MNPSSTLLRHAAILSALALGIGLSACGGGGGQEPLAPDRTVAFEVLETNAFSSVRTRRTAVASDDPSWAALWAEHKASVNPQPPRPAVAFPRESVAAVFLGEVAACNRPRIDAVIESAGVRMTLRWTHVPPQPTELCIAAIQSPVQMVRFDNPARLPVVFVQAP